MGIEFQHRGSPRAHILLWLENDPKDEIPEDMTAIVQMVDHLCSVKREDLGSEKYSNRAHRHTFTCTERGETRCRFNIPYWPIENTCILLPMPREDGRLKGYQLKTQKVRESLETKNYDSIDTFLHDNM